MPDEQPEAIVDDIDETEALERAENEGIEFIDFYVISSKLNPFEILDNKNYETSEAAEAALALIENPEDYRVMQSRRQKVTHENTEV